jgi:hypothetical protein
MGDKYCRVVDAHAEYYHLCDASGFNLCADRIIPVTRRVMGLAIEPFPMHVQVFVCYD